MANFAADVDRTRPWMTILSPVAFHLRPEGSRQSTRASDTGPVNLMVARYAEPACARGSRVVTNAMPDVGAFVPVGSAAGVLVGVAGVAVLPPVASETV